MRLPLSYPMIAHAAFASILAMACTDPSRTTQPAQSSPAGTIVVSVTTSGSDLDEDGYVISAGRPSDGEGFSGAARLPVNGSATMSGLPPDTYSMILAGLAPNCDPGTGVPQKIVVANGRVTKLNIDIQCTSSLQLTYRVGPRFAADDSLSIAGQFWIMDLNGRNFTRLTTDTASHESPTWSPDGSRMAFESNRGGRAGIWILEANGTTVPVNTGLAAEFGPRWSPDAKRLVFSSPIAGMMQLFSINADGTDRRIITNGSPGDYDPDWSPDGKKIAFASKRGDIEGIWIINADGTNPIRLTSGLDSKPVWSPDGATIAFSRADTRNRYTLSTMKSDGSAQPVTLAVLTYPVHPAWSPNGRKIAFSTTPCPTKNACYEFIQFVGIDGTEYTEMTVPGNLSGDVAWRQRR
jgi:Tol biopolymer transport system component